MNSAEQTVTWLITLGVLESPKKSISDPEAFLQSSLKDGVVLCRLLERLSPGSTEKVYPEPKNDGECLSNIKEFLRGCTSFRVEPFEASDLLLGLNFSKVLSSLVTLNKVTADIGVGSDSVCARHSSAHRIKSFESLSTQASLGRSSKLLQNQFRSLDMSENSGQQLLVKARFNFQQTNEDELTFNKGDIINVTRQEEGGWWEGMLNGKTGWFPSNYVRDVKGSEKAFFFVKMRIFFLRIKEFFKIIPQLPSHPLTPSRHAEGRSMTVAPTYHTLPHQSSHGTTHSTLMWGPLEPPNTPKPWSLSCLRPAPPLRPSAALCYKEDLSKSPKSVKKLLPKRKPERKQSEEEFALRKSTAALEEDAQILKVIEAYCTSAKTRQTLNSRRGTGLHVIIPGEDKVFVEDPSRNGQSALEEKSLVDVVYALRDEVQELKQDNKKMKRSLEEEQRARKDLEKVVRRVLKSLNDPAWDETNL
ncbi:rho guanine nucleotide exchange factor 7a [Nematolebias whitei]|uniref:rho guanine nucleotide exchange factor 7a n=1 Tax=Nematolebias whitei TaxID=451745 RepID=UPI0018993D53|nr:rho guanine nucleotide exchange factor 7a [Nematolebias whitei]